MRSRAWRDRRGMTLVELLVALLVMGLVTSAALALVQQQQMAFEAGTGRMDVLQNYRFAADLLERELRTAGSGVVDGQPFLVYADGATLAFNADFATNDTVNEFAVYRNPTAPIEEVGALTRGRRLRLPGTSFEYPDSTYRDGEANSPAETIVFFFAPDTSTADALDFALFRQVNDLSPAVVARNLLPVEGREFFEYQEVAEEENGSSRTTAVPETALPLRHAAPLHLSAGDVGVGARIDRVRAVRISFASTNGETSEARKQSREMSRLVSMPNAGVRRLQICGDAPVFLAAVTATQVPGESRVEVRWSASADDGGGEADVVRYAIFRRRPAGDWGEPFFSVPGGLSSYAYTDGSVAMDSTYQYAVSAQDCTPAMSGLRTSGNVTIGVSP